MQNRLAFLTSISKFFYLLLFCLVFDLFPLLGSVKPGIDCMLPEYRTFLYGKKIGLVTNHTAINSEGVLTVDIIKKNAAAYNYSLSALFAPEHGLTGEIAGGELVEGGKDADGVPIYSLHGDQRRPTPKMLKDLSLIIYDIQDIGSRSYTYISTLFQVMEEASKARIPVIVLDRPNPLGGLLVDGPMLDDKWRSFVGYINVPYCYGMTVGELAKYFNIEYRVGCTLIVVPMEGWKRSMTFDDTGLIWIPTSPQIPQAETAFYYPTTGLLGELTLINMGVGYTLPFRVVGAPWIDAKQFADQLNAQNFPGVFFLPFHYRPFFGRFAKESCHGVYIVVRDSQVFLPISTQFLIMGTLKNLYPREFQKALENSREHHEMFNKVCGTDEVLRLLKEEKFLVWKLRAIHQRERELFLTKRARYLFPQYD